MNLSAEEATEQAVFVAQETLLSLGIFIGGIAILLFAVAVGLVMVEQGSLQSRRGRSTRIKPGA